jgi:hypothetical protein
MTHREMVEQYPNYLIGFYERNIQIGEVRDIEPLVAADIANDAGRLLNP